MDSKIAYAENNSVQGNTNYGLIRPKHVGATSLEIAAGDEQCVECKEIVKKGSVINATGHNWNEGIIIKLPTDTEEGIKEFTCSVCGSTRQEIIGIIEIPEGKYIRNNKNIRGEYIRDNKDIRAEYFRNGCQK